MTGEQLTELEMMRVKSAHSAGYMAGLADAQKQARYWSGRVALKQVRMKCPVCNVESPVQDPDADLLAALKELLEACKDAKFARDPFDAVPKAQAAIAKVEGHA